MKYVVLLGLVTFTGLLLLDGNGECHPANIEENRETLDILSRQKRAEGTTT